MKNMTRNEIESQYISPPLAQNPGSIYAAGSVLGGFFSTERRCLVDVSERVMPGEDSSPIWRFAFLFVQDFVHGL